MGHASALPSDLSSLNASLADDLGAMGRAGTRKTFRYISGPMDAEVTMEERGRVLVLSSNNYLGLANHPEVIAAGKQALCVVQRCRGCVQIAYIKSEDREICLDGQPQEAVPGGLSGFPGG